MCKSEMSACAVRDLETTRVILVLLRAIPANVLQFAVSTSYDSYSIFLPRFRVIGTGREGALSSE